MACVYPALGNDRKTFCLVDDLGLEIKTANSINFLRKILGNYVASTSRSSSRMLDI